jgi:hypothetical protein
MGAEKGEHDLLQYKYCWGVARCLALSVLYTNTACPPSHRIRRYQYTHRKQNTQLFSCPLRRLSRLTRTHTLLTQAGEGGVGTGSQEAL